MEIFVREQGFALGDQFVTMTKRRYRLPTARAGLQAVHYLVRDQNSPRIPVQPQYSNQAMASAGMWLCQLYCSFTLPIISLPIFGSCFLFIAKIIAPLFICSPLKSYFISSKEGEKGNYKCCYLFSHVDSLRAPPLLLLNLVYQKLLMPIVFLVVRRIKVILLSYSLSR
jgi:hypothetical protein